MLIIRIKYAIKRFFYRFRKKEKIEKQIFIYEED